MKGAKSRFSLLARMITGNYANQRIPGIFFSETRVLTLRRMNFLLNQLKKIK